MKRSRISRDRNHSTKKAMEGTPCKLSMFVYTTFLYDTPGCGPHTERLAVLILLPRVERKPIAASLCVPLGIQNCHESLFFRV